MLGRVAYWIKALTWIKLLRIQTPPGALLGFETQPHYAAAGGLVVKIRIMRRDEFELMRFCLPAVTSISRGTDKQHSERKKTTKKQTQYLFSLNVF